MKLYDLVDFMTKLTPIVLLIAVIGSLRNVRRMHRVSWLFLGYLIIALGTDLLCRFVGFFAENNLIIIPLFGILEVSVFYIFYVRFWKVTHPLFLSIYIAIIGFAIFELCLIHKTDSANFQAYSKVLGNLLIIIMSFSISFKQISSEVVHRSATLVFNHIIFVYFSILVVLFIPINFLVNAGSDLIFYFWLINIIATTSFYGFIGYLLWKHGNHPKQLLSGLFSE